MTSRGAKYWSSGAIPLIAPDLLGGIIGSASDIAVVMTDLGEVLSVLQDTDRRPIADSTEWEGRDFRSTLAIDSVPKFDRRLAEISAQDNPGGAMELNHPDGAGGFVPVRYTSHPVGPDGAILFLGRDLRPVAEMQQQLVAAQMALERDYESNREASTRLRVLLETSRDAVMFVRVSTGRISELNGAASRLLGAAVDDLAGAPLARDLAAGDGGPLDVGDLIAASRDETSSTLDLLTRRGRRVLRTRTTLFRAGGERLLLLRMEPSETSRETPGDMAARLGKFFDRSPDGLIFTDRSGVVMAVNDALLELMDADDASAIKGRSIADILGRGSVDLKVLTDNAVRNGHMRIYATKLLTAFGAEVPVEISTAFLDDPNHAALALTIRDAGRLEAMRGTAGTPQDEGAHSARELVGAATLKDIVAETTEVVEKMCIETAVELTGNNRVAAAEMLGLSRQSLYVKLRKYGLLARDA